MEMERELYSSNGMLGLIPVLDDSEAMQFHFGKLTTDSKDFFNCDTSIGLDYPGRSALQPICVHVGGTDFTYGIEKCDENVELLDISSKRLPVDLGIINGPDKASGYTNGSYTTNNHVMENSLPASEHGPVELTTDSPQCNDFYMRAEYSSHAPVDNERIYYNNNQPVYMNGFHNHDHTSHHLNHHHHHQPHYNHHQQQSHYNHQSQPSTPLNPNQPQKKQHQTFPHYPSHRRRLNLYEKPPKPSPTKQKPRQQLQQPQPPLKQSKLLKPLKPIKPLKPQKVHKLPRTQPQKSPKSPRSQKTQRQPMVTPKRKYKRHLKTLEDKPELNHRIVPRKQTGRVRKYDYSPPKPVRFRSHRLRLKVQSEGIEVDDEPDAAVSMRSDRRKPKEAQEVLPVNWVRPENLSFDRHIVSDYEKESLPEFFAGKYDRTHFHPSQYLQIRNIFLDEWESRKPQTVNFREMIRVHRGIGNVVSFSRVCKFLTAIGAINDSSQSDVVVSGNKEDDESCYHSLDPSSDPSLEDSQSKADDEEPEEPKESSSPQPLLSPSPLSSSSPPPSCSSSLEVNGLSPSATTTPSEDNSSQAPTSRPRRRGRKRKSYFLNEMTRLGIDPLSAGFPIPEFKKYNDQAEKASKTSTSPATRQNDDKNKDSENISNRSVQD